MGVTGYERKAYADLASIARNTERIADALTHPPDEIRVEGPPPVTARDLVNAINSPAIADLDQAVDRLEAVVRGAVPPYSQTQLVLDLTIVLTALGREP